MQGTENREFDLSEQGSYEAEQGDESAQTGNWIRQTGKWRAARPMTPCLAENAGSSLGRSCTATPTKPKKNHLVSQG
jgi:hypothetical protein